MTLAVLLLLGTACQPKEPSSVLPVKGRGGELRVLVPAEPRGFDPNSTGEEMGPTLAPSFYNSLVALDSEGRLLPDLARSWQVSDGGRTYTFHLNGDATWHDGRPFSSADVRFTFERLKAHPSLAAEAVRRIARIETPDPLTAVLRLEEPWAPLLPTLAWNGAYILPRHLGAPKPGDRPVGTGPFRLIEWVKGERLVLAANPRFHRPGPFVDRLVYLLLPDSAQAAEALLRGEADYSMTRVPLDQLPRLDRSPGVRVRNSPSSSRYYCAFNLNRRPLGDRRVREAVNRALDRNEIVRRALFGYGAPALGFYTPSVGWAYNGEAHVPPFDPGRARALIDAAGARSAELELVVPDVSPVVEMGDLIRDQLAGIGLRVRVKRLPLTDWFDRAIRRRDYDLTIIAGMQGPDPENLRLRFGSASPAGVPGYASAELDAALAEGAANLDLQRRALAYSRAQAVLARDLPIAPLAEAVHVAVFRSNVRGLPHVEARGLVPPNDFSLVRVRP